VSNSTITIIGRIGKEPMPIGEKGLKLRIASNERMKNEATGQWENKRTSWWNVKLWNGLADQSKGVLQKGQEVIIVGDIFEETWIDPSSGVEKTSYEIKANQIAVTTHSLNMSKSAEYAGVPF
jgi:single-strand DNA-binding protein